MIIVTFVFAISGNGEGLSSGVKSSLGRGGIKSTMGIKSSGLSPSWSGMQKIYVDNTYGNGALSNYPNLLILNSSNFGSGADKNYFSSEAGTTFRIRTFAGVNVPFWVQSYSVGSQTGRIWFKFSNGAAAKDSLILYSGGNSLVPDSSHLEVVFPAGDDFNNSTYSNLVQINDSATGLSANQSWANLEVTDTSNNHNARHAIGRVSNLIYYPTDVTEPYKVLTAGNATGQGFTTDSSQIWLWTSTTRNGAYTPNAQPVISDKTGGATTHGGCSDPYLVLVKGASSATDSLYCFFFYDSTLTGANNDGIYVAASQASDGVTWTEKTKILSNATNRIKNPVVIYEGGVWYLFYGYQIEAITNKERAIGLATSANVRSTFSVSSNTFIIPSRTVSGVNAADSNSVVPVSIAKIGSTYYLSYEGTFANDDGNGIGGFFTGTGGANPSLATFARTAPLGEANNMISRAVFTFLDSVDVSTGLGGFLWQQGGSDSGAFRFDFVSRIYNETYNELNSKNYFVYGRGTQIPQNFAPYDTIRSQYHVRDSSGYRIFGANQNTYHPYRFSGGSGGLMTYNYPVTQDFEITTEIQNRNWRVVNSAANPSTVFGFTIAVGDTPVCSDSLQSSGNTKFFWNYTNARDATGIWSRTFLKGSNYFQINDTAAISSVVKGDFLMGRFGFTTDGDTGLANAVDYVHACSTWVQNRSSVADQFSIISYRYPQIGTTKDQDSVLTVFLNGVAVAQTPDKFDAVQRARSKKFIGFGFNDYSSGAGGEGIMKYWFYRPIQTNYREPQTYLVKYNPTLADTSHYTVGQGTYDSSYVKDAYIVYWGASNAERTWNTGGSAAANNSLGYVNSAAIEESRGLLWFSNAMLPANFILDSAVIDLYLTAGNVGGTDADGNIFMVSECLRDWVEGNKTTYAVGSMDRTMCSWTRRGSGTGVGGTTIAASDSNWFSRVGGHTATTNREHYSHIWGISSPDTIKAVGTGRDNTHVTFNVTPITRKQLSTGINFGYVIRDISAKPTGTGNYYKRPDSRESATAGQRPTITYFGRLAS